MPEPPPRKRFQIHLSTAVVMMFVAGALIWANVSGEAYVVRYERKYLVPQQFTVTWKNVGFPVRSAYPVDTSDAPIAYAKSLRDKSVGLGVPTLLINILFAVFALWFTWFLCEWLIRRRAARKAQ